MRLLGPAVAMVLVIAASACHGDQERPANLAPLIRDSAGVRIVENPRPTTESRLGWQIGSVPDVTIGAAEGDPPYLFDRVRDAMRLRDGRVVVADGGSGELRVFDASGRHASTWSREGEGPGEFTSLAGVARWPGDSLVAWNSRVGAISVFDPEGTSAAPSPSRAASRRQWRPCCEGARSSPCANHWPNRRGPLADDS